MVTILLILAVSALVLAIASTKWPTLWIAVVLLAIAEALRSLPRYLPLLLLSLLPMAAGSCKTLGQAMPDQKDVVDCTTQSVVSQLGKLEPFAFQLLMSLRGADGHVDWGAFEAALVNLAATEGVCLLLDMEAKLAGRTAALMPPMIELTNVVDGLERTRQTKWPGIKGKTAGGLR